MSRFAEIGFPPEDLQRARAGDRAAQGRLYAAFAAPVYGLARRLLQDPALAEDVVQETYIEVMRGLASFRGDSPPGFWVRRIAVNRCLMLLRAPWWRRRDALDAEPVAGPDGADAGLDLERALARLPVTARTVVWLHDVEGYTHGEIGRLFGKSASFSKSRLARAYERLRAELGEGEEACMPVSSNC